MFNIRIFKKLFVCNGHLHLAPIFDFGEPRPQNHVLFPASNHLASNTCYHEIFAMFNIRMQTMLFVCNEFPSVFNLRVHIEEEKKEDKKQSMLNHG